jgi:ABC-type uncharacterized transport system permease subunit
MNCKEMCRRGFVLAFALLVLSCGMLFAFRAEFFNIFNHAQFITPSGILSSGFGQVTQAQPPRLGQLSLKLNF